ncbi:hypothetical protein, partial [Escherichia coli]
KKLIMLPSETMIWQPEFTDKTLSRKPGAVQRSKNYKKNNYKNIPVDKWITPREVFSGIVCKQNI